jgi:formylglycine-generating enzyme required for sulfatase activity
LPTEAEWEYAARGGRQGRETIYSGSDTLDEVAWHSSGRTYPVGTKAPNELGLHDMSGNVSEWVHDWYQSSYRRLATTDPAGPASGSARVVRGGSWANTGACRVTARERYGPGMANQYTGFRVVLGPPL